MRQIFFTTDTHFKVTAVGCCAGHISDDGHPKGYASREDACQRIVVEFFAKALGSQWRGRIRGPVSLPSRCSRYVEQVGEAIISIIAVCMRYLVLRPSACNVKHCESMCRGIRRHGP